MFRGLVVWCGLICCAVAQTSFVDVVEGPQRGARIVGGQNAALGQFPYQISLRTTAGSHFCGGFVISNRFMGTAAHCTQLPRTTGNIVAVVGTIQRSGGGVTHRLARIINHPNFDSSNLANDVSVLQTVQTIVFNNIVAPVIIGSNFIQGGVNAIATGFGQISRSGPASSQLLWVGLRTLTNDECRSKFSRSNAARILDTTICTFTRVGAGTCMGDSGGPLVMNNNVLIGIVSWGIPCANGHPDVYARVSSHRAWIMNQVQ